MFHYHYLIFACMLTYFVRCFFSYLVFHVCFFFSLSPEVYSEKCTCWNWYKMLISLKKGQRYFDKNLSIFSLSEWISGMHFVNAKWKPNCEIFFQSFSDTFASKTAAIQDETADASVGNVTGSNAVNVFLGIGIAWTMAAIYWESQGLDFKVEPGR